MDHAALLVSDVDRSRRFYAGVLGLDEIARPASFTFPGAWFRCGDAEIHLIGEAQAGRTRERHPGYDPEELETGYGTHTAFEVTDLVAAQRHLDAHGIAVEGGPRPRGDGVQQLYVRDPDGHIVELFAWEAGRRG